MFTWSFGALSQATSEESSPDESSGDRSEAGRGGPGTWEVLVDAPRNRGSKVGAEVEFWR